MRAEAGLPPGRVAARAWPAATTTTCPRATAVRCRKLVRDVVDSRRNVGSFFLVIAAVALIGTIVPSSLVKNYASLLLFGFFLVMIVDSVVLSRRIKRKVAERFPNGDHSTPRPGLVRHQPVDDDPPLALPEARRRRWAPRSERPLAAAASGGGQEASTSVGDVEFRRLGRSGLTISEIAYGNWLTHGGQVEEDAAHACVRAALDAGITTFDTADVYAGTRAEAVLGRALRGAAARRPTSCSPRSTGRPARAGTTAACPASTSSRAATPRWSGCRPTTSTSTRPTATTRRCRSRRR